MRERIPVDPPAFSTVQMSASAAGGSHMVHVGHWLKSGGVDNNACGLDRHAKGLGFSVGGGWTDPHAFACPDCLAVVEAARERSDGTKVTGMFRHLFTQPPGAIS